MKQFLKKFKLYDKVKYLVKDRKSLTKKYIFENRMKSKEKICFILAGYKEFSYDIVFSRIKKFVPKDVEVCILSSGKYSEKLSKIASDNDWSYLSTEINNVSLVTNLAISLHPEADYIFKMDEDIFITKVKRPVVLHIFS